MSGICEKIDADWQDITKALKLDRRIGKYSYIQTGLGLSGGNLERDLITSIKLCNKYKIDSAVFKSFLFSSKINNLWAVKKFKENCKKLNKKDKITILGLTYKENTNSIKNSPSVDLIKKLNFKNISCYDPEADLQNLKLNIKRYSKMSSAIKNCKVLIIMTKWEEFKKIKITDLKDKMTGKLIIDPYGLLSNLHLNEMGYKYFSKGKK